MNFLRKSISVMHNGSVITDVCVLRQNEEEVHVQAEQEQVIDSDRDKCKMDCIEMDRGLRL